MLAQLFASSTCTVYVAAAVTSICCVVSPVDHKYPLNPDGACSTAGFAAVGQFSRPVAAIVGWAGRGNMMACTSARVLSLLNEAIETK